MSDPLKPLRFGVVQVQVLDAFDVKHVVQTEHHHIQQQQDENTIPCRTGYLCCCCSHRPWQKTQAGQSRALLSTADGNSAELEHASL